MLVRRIAWAVGIDRDASEELEEFCYERVLFLLYLSAGSGFDDADAVDILPVVLVLLAFMTYYLLRR